MNKSPFDLNNQNKNIDYRIVASLERISEAFRVLLWDEGKKYNLSPIQVQALIFLLNHDEKKRKISYLAQEFNMTKPTISDVIKTLEQKELIKKEYEKHDTRSYVIHLTNKGVDLAKKTSSFTNKLHVPISELHPEDKENLLLSLMTIINQLTKSGVITIQRMCFNCMHYQESREGKPHFCKLLNMKLAPSDLRIDCPEYELAENLK